jgi:hypothetical protein
MVITREAHRPLLKLITVSCGNSTETRAHVFTTYKVDSYLHGLAAGAPQ